MLFSSFAAASALRSRVASRRSSFFLIPTSFGLYVSFRHVLVATVTGGVY